MSNKASPRRRSVANKRYDEDYEYYVPVRQYNKNTRSKDAAAAAAEEEVATEEGETVKRRRGRPAAGKNLIHTDD